MFLGSSVGLIFFLFVYNTEKLQVHPMRLIMYLVLLESSFQIILAQNFYICEWKQNELLSYTLWFSATDEEVLAATYLLIYSANYLACFCIQMSLCLNTALCLELIFLVRYPFERKEKRSRVYYIVSILVSIIISTIAIIFPPTNFWIHLVNGMILGLTGIYILTFIASLIYCCKKLYGAGISKEVRR